MGLLGRIINRTLGRLGYQVRKTYRIGEDLDLYRTLYDEQALRERRFYNVGAGGFRHPAWTNVDKVTDYYRSAQGQQADMDWDLLDHKPLPIESGKAEALYTGHTIEHVTDSAAENLLREAHRVLRPGGWLRVSCPDIALAYRAMRDGDRHFFWWIDLYSRPREMERAHIGRPMDQASLEQVFLYYFASSLSILHKDGAADRVDDAELERLFSELGFEGALNHCVERCPMEIQQRYPHNHINWWTREKLSSAMRSAGFEDIHVSGFGQSRCPPMRNTSLFDKTHVSSSLYVEARKGA